MIDIHCHILPDLDDGAADLDEALHMARMAVESGVTDIIATPHFQGSDEAWEMTTLIDQRFTQLKTALQRTKLPLQLHIGAEILCMPQTAALAFNHRLPTLGKTDYVLVEFYFDESFTFMDELLRQIAASGYRPVVAHPERYEAIQRDPELVQHWGREGYVIQLNKGSVLGAFGSRVERTANELLAMGIVHLFASDAHSYRSRTPHMHSLHEWISAHCNDEYAAILLEENPRRLLQNRPMVGMDG